MSIAVSCQTAPSVPLQPADVEAVDPDQLAGPVDVDVRLWLGYRAAARRARHSRRSAPGAWRACSGRGGSSAFQTPLG